jgi:8-oxo-dGTP pyrophosphatase MutT (NUDIX family)
MRARFPVTVHLLFFRDDQVLLLRRFNTGYEDGNYSVPAGHLDGGEPVRVAAAREAEEEIGLRLIPAQIEFAGVIHRMEEATLPGTSERVDFFVHVREWTGEPFNAEPDKCDELRWCDPDALPENTIPYVRQAIQNFRDGLLFEEYGWTS